MQEIFEFFRGLLDTDRWPPRWKCGYWSDFHGWLYILSDLMIWLAYFLIPLIILKYFTNKKTSIRFKRVYLLFAAFILLCGATHFLDATMFWVPAYRLNALVRSITAVVSLFTVYHLVCIMPQMVKLRTAPELEMEIARREEVERSLGEANERLAAFASIASHDLQEPLRKIMTYSEMVFNHPENHFRPASLVHIEKIKQSSDRMQGLIQDVLALSTLKEDVALGPVQPAAAIVQAMENLELTIAEKAAVIEIGEMPLVLGNQPYIVQVFSNLLGNAMKFNTNIPHIRICARSHDKVVLIDVTDNGIGLQTEHYEKIFRAFERVHTKHKYAGSGIGLAICKRIMDIHQGSISVTSEAGKGTTFTLTFQSASGAGTA